jgi:protein-disulfide isomerase
MSSNDRTRTSSATTRRERRRAERDRRAADPRRRSPAGSAARGGPSLGVIATVAALVGGVILIGAIVLLQRPAATGGGSPTSGLGEPSINVPADLGDTPNALGSPDAPLTMEVTEDFQCPICARFAHEQLPRLIDDFVRPGLLRIVTHDVAFLDRGDSKESLLSAAAASCAAQQGRYWEYHDWLYANQHGENEGAFTQERLAAIADAIELDRAAFDACVSDPSSEAAVTAATNAALGAGINATPTLVVNGGQPIAGLPQYDQLASYLRGLLPSGAPSGAPAGSPSGSSAASPSA